MSVPVWILLAAGLAVAGLAACMGQRDTAKAGSFAVGQELKLARPAALRQVGQRRLLVVPVGKEPVMLNAGTRIEVADELRDNTLTRGIERWLELEIRDGKLAGERAFLPADEAKAWLRSAPR